MMEDEPKRFKNYLRRADLLVNSRERLRDLATQATGKLSGIASIRIDTVRDQLNLCIALVRSWMRGEYDGVSRQTIVAVTAAILYFVVPFDLIPDFLLGWGFVDDASVVGYVMAMLAVEMDAFRQWKEQDVKRRDPTVTAGTKKQELV